MFHVPNLKWGESDSTPDQTPLSKGYLGMSAYQWAVLFSRWLRKIKESMSLFWT